MATTIDPNKTVTTTPASISNAQNVTIGDKTFALDYANNPANAEELRQAIVNGRNQVSVSDSKGNVWNNATGAQTSYAPPEPLKPVVPAFDAQAYINQATSAGYAGIDSANKARQDSINARLAENLSSQDGLIRDAEGNLVKNTATIQGNTYDAQETQKANGVQRGIQYSQQQQALENGISRAGTKMIVDAGKERDTAIANIKDRIAGLKSGASLDLQASQAQADADKANLLQSATTSAMNRANQLSDMQTQYNREDAVTADNRAYTKEEQQANWTREDDVYEKQKADEMAKEGRTWTHEDAVQEKVFQNQLTVLGIDQANKVALANLDFNQKKEFLKLETGQQKELLAIKQKYDIDIFNMTSAQQIKLQGMSSASQMALAQFDASTQKSLLETKNVHDDAQFQAELTAKANDNINTMWSSYIMNDPGFNMYPNAKDNSTINGAQVAKLKQYFTVNGVPTAIQDQMLKGKITPKDVVDMSAKNTNKTVNAIKDGIANILKFK